jgi:segregation and condensation protein B
VPLRRPLNLPTSAIIRSFGHLDSEAPTGEQARSGALAVVEAVLFAADEPVSPRRLAAAAGLSSAMDARQIVQQLRNLYRADGSAFIVEELAGGYQLLTRAEFHPWLARLRRHAPDLKISGAARETLTIIAYRQPITRADLEGIRGVQSGEMIRQLIERGLVRIAGRDESLGRPVLYGTTKKFLQLYGLNSVRDLPRAAELTGPAKKKPIAEAE